MFLNFTGVVGFWDNRLVVEPVSPKKQVVVF